MTSAVLSVGAYTGPAVEGCQFHLFVIERRPEQVRDDLPYFSVKIMMIVSHSCVKRDVNQ